jgi:glycosyltransferase involved in cell wall biosynthesis
MKLKIVMFMKMYKNLTIVIPCKNESNIIGATLSLLNQQNNIENVSVIIADSSTDSTTFELESRVNDRFNLTIVQGGLPSIARNNGAKKVTTPYVLFMDADMFIIDSKLLEQSVKIMKKEKLHLLTTKVRTTTGEYNYIYKSFDIIQKIIKPFTPFCLGGFMLFDTEEFNKLGGFDESIKVAEDYLLSKKVKPSKFKIINKHIFTTPRRFKNKGVLYMVKLMIQSFIHRNNKQFFSKHNTYWK